MGQSLPSYLLFLKKLQNYNFLNLKDKIELSKFLKHQKVYFKKIIIINK